MMAKHVKKTSTCSECGGAGTVPELDIEKRNQGHVMVCPECGGSGVVTK